MPLRRASLLLVLAAGLSGCTPTPTPTVTVTSTATVTVTVPATATPGASATPTGPNVPTGDALDVSAWERNDFASPSGRIWCGVTADNALCHFPQGYKGSIPTGDEVCPGEGLDVTGVMVGGQEARFFCSGDPTAYPVRGGSTVVWHQSSGYPYVTFDELVLAVLPYGRALQHGTYVCASADTGVTCANRVTGHGFRMAVAGAVFF